MTTVLQRTGKELIRQHIPGFDYAEQAYMFLQEAKTESNDSIITQLINRGGKDAKKQLRNELTKHYGDPMSTLIDVAVDTAMDTKQNNSAEDLAETFVKV